MRTSIDSRTASSKAYCCEVQAESRNGSTDTYEKGARRARALQDPSFAPISQNLRDGALNAALAKIDEQLQSNVNEPWLWLFRASAHTKLFATAEARRDLDCCLQAYLNSKLDDPFMCGAIPSAQRLIDEFEKKQRP